MRVANRAYVPFGFEFETYYGKPKIGATYPIIRTFYEVPTFKEAKRLAKKESKWNKKLGRSDIVYIVFKITCKNIGSFHDSFKKDLCHFTVSPEFKQDLNKLEKPLFTTQ